MLVHRRARRQGLGAELMRAAEQAARLRPDPPAPGRRDRRRRGPPLRATRLATRRRRPELRPHAGRCPVQHNIFLPGLLLTGLLAVLAMVIPGALGDEGGLSAAPCFPGPSTLYKRNLLVVLDGSLCLRPESCHDARQSSPSDAFAPVLGLPCSSAAAQSSGRPRAVGRPGPEGHAGLVALARRGRLNAARSAHGLAEIADGGRVETWYDASGRGRHLASRARTARPRFLDGAMRFDGEPATWSAPG